MVIGVTWSPSEDITSPMSGIDGMLGWARQIMGATTENRRHIASRARRDGVAGRVPFEDGDQA